MTCFKLLRHLAGLAVLGAAGFYLVGTLRDLKDQILRADFVPSFWSIGLSAVLCSVWLFCLVAGWRWVLIQHTNTIKTPGVIHLARAYIQSFLTRYAPGKIWPAIIRANLLAPGVPVQSTLRSYVIEQLHLGASSALLSIGIFLPYGTEVENISASEIFLIFLGCCVAITWVTFPRQIFGFLRFILPESSKIASSLSFVGSMKEWVLGFFIYIAIGFIQGMAILPLWAAVSSEPLSVLESVFLVCSYAGARFAGQAATVVPAGLGVREGIFIFLTSPLSAQAAVISVLWVRAIASIVELLGFAVVTGLAATRNIVTGKG